MTSAPASLNTPLPAFPAGFPFSEQGPIGAARLPAAKSRAFGVDAFGALRLPKPVAWAPSQSRPQMRLIGLGHGVLRLGPGKRLWGVPGKGRGRTARSVASAVSDSTVLRSAPQHGERGEEDEAQRLLEQTQGEKEEGASSSSSGSGSASVERGVQWRENEEEFRAQWIRQPKRIAIFVEPSPFDYVCGYKNRFQNFIKYLREGGDEVLVVTTHKGAPEEFHGAKVVPSWSFSFPFYPILPVSFAMSPRLLKRVADFNPDLIHSTSPGIMCFGALLIAKILSKPLVFSYHTHVPVYIPKYTFSFLVGPMWLIIRLLHWAGDLTLVTSRQLGQELLSNKAVAADRICVWRKGVDAVLFNPKFKSAESRTLLSGGESQKPLLMYVGRLGAEKNLSLLRPLLDRLPNVRLAFVGDGPFRMELERVFEGTPTVFTGMLSGEPLSQAYASADVFVMPSESETLGFVVLEAMASGVPVVAARAGGIPDIVSQDGVTGFLFHPGDVEDMAAKVGALVASPELRRRTAEAARAEVERLDWRAATRSVREEHYSAAVWLHLRSKAHSLARSLWLWRPWWLKRSELQTLF